MATGRIGVTPNLGIRWSKVPTGGTTSLSGNDDNSVPLAYSAGYEAVYRNGVLLSRGNDYTATNGTSITLTNATITGDLIEVFANQTVALTDTYSQSAANAKFINNTLTTTTGDIIYASAANTPARLGIGSTSQVLTVSGGVPAWATPSSPSLVGCSLTMSAVQSISNSTNTTLTWNTEKFDTNSFHDTTTNTARITIPSGYAGKYVIFGNMKFAGNSTGDRQVFIDRFNSSGTNLESFDGYLTRAAGTYQTGYSIYRVGELNVGDYLTMYCWQNSGGSLNTGYTLQEMNFGVIYLGA
jgi:hypothetical protein